MFGRNIVMCAAFGDVDWYVPIHSCRFGVRVINASTQRRWYTSSLRKFDSGWYRKTHTRELTSWVHACRSVRIESRLSGHRTCGRLSFAESSGWLRYMPNMCG